MSPFSLPARFARIRGLEKVSEVDQSPVEVSKVSNEDQVDKIDEEEVGTAEADNADVDDFGDAFEDAANGIDADESGDDDADDRDDTDTEDSDNDDTAGDDVDGDDKQGDDSDKDDAEGNAEDEIDYKAELERERNRTRSWEGRLSKAEREKQDALDELNALKANKSPAAEKGDTGESDNADSENTEEADAEMEAFYEEFPSLRKPLEILQNRAVNKAVSEATGRVNETIKPIVSRAEEEDSAAHSTAIYKAHSDLDEITSSGKLDAWIDEQSPRIANAYREIIADGSTGEVISMLDDYKNDRGIEDNGDDEAGPDDKDKKTTQRKKATQRSRQAEDLEPVKSPKSRPNPRGSQADQDDFDGAFDEASRSG